MRGEGSYEGLEQGRSPSVFAELVEQAAKLRRVDETLGRGVAEGALDKRRVLAVEAQIGKRSLGAGDRQAAYPGHVAFVDVSHPKTCRLDF